MACLQGTGLAGAAGGAANDFVQSVDFGLRILLLSFTSLLLVLNATQEPFEVTLMSPRSFMLSPLELGVLDVRAAVLAPVLRLLTALVSNASFVLVQAGEGRGAIQSISSTQPCQLITNFTPEFWVVDRMASLAGRLSLLIVRRPSLGIARRAAQACQRRTLTQFGSAGQS